MKYPKVKVTVLESGYEVKVSVFRHVTEPDTISVNIIAISALPPVPMIDTAGDVSKVVAGGKGAKTFEVDVTYPYQE